jgi:enoyl-[acyl-carrier-protein] reductase (NADH)
MPAVEALQAEIRAEGVEAHFFNVNAADPVQRATVLDTMGDVFAAHGGGSFRLLMHSLAFGTLKPFIANEPKEALTQAQMEMTMNVMANSLVYWTQDVVARGMMTSGGRVVAMTSSGSHRVLPHYGAVSAAKAALESYCRQLAFELGPKGITVNAIQAGVTVTPALQKIPGADKIISHAEERNPLGRLTSPEDIASALMMVMSDGFGWLNGTVLRLDGGEDAVELDWTRRE